MAIILPIYVAKVVSEYDKVTGDEEMWYNKKHIGDSPSGKAVGSGPTIRGFESLISSQVEIIIKLP